MNDMRKLMESLGRIEEDEDLVYRGNTEIVDRLEEIQDEMLDLLGEAENLVSGTGESDRAKSYWLAHIETALTNHHGYLGGSMTTMQDSIEALRDDEGSDDYDEDEPVERYDDEGEDEDAELS